MLYKLFRVRGTCNRQGAIGYPDKFAALTVVLYQSDPAAMVEQARLDVIQKLSAEGYEHVLPKTVVEVESPYILEVTP